MTTTWKNSCLDDGVTIQVADVEVSPDRLPTVKTHQAASEQLGCSVEVASDYSDNCVQGISYNPLIAAAHLAFCHHYPLVLSPDTIWLTLVQGLATHLEQNWGRYRDQILVNPSTDIQMIEVSTEEFPFGSPENPWDELVTEATSQARTRVTPEFNQLFQANFSTSKKLDQIGLDLALLELVKNEFPVTDSPFCGIPSITLQGRKSDWEVMLSHMSVFREFGLHTWVDELRSILHQFVDAFEGRIDHEFWSSLYQSGKEICGTHDAVTGWIGKLFPFLRSSSFGRHKNPLVDGDGEELPTVDHFPSGLRGIKMRSQRGSVVKLTGGLIGVTQDPTTGELKPKPGWAMSRSHSLSKLFRRMQDSKYCELVKNSIVPEPLDLTNPTLQEFYRQFQSIRIHKDSRLLLQLCRREEMHRVDPRETKSEVAPLLAIGSIGRHRLITYTLNGFGNYAPFERHVFPMFFLETESGFRYVTWDIRQLISFYLDIAEGHVDEVETNELGPLVDPLDYKQTYPIKQRAKDYLQFLAGDEPEFH